MDEEERNGEIFFSKYLEINRKEIPFEYKYFYYKNNKIGIGPNPQSPIPITILSYFIWRNFYLSNKNLNLKNEKK